MIAVFSGTTDAGYDRARYAALQLREIVAPTGVQAARPLDANEGRRLAETVRALSADRERLLTRIGALEHNIDDMTGSITRFEKAVRTPAPSIEQLQPVAPPQAANTPLQAPAPQATAPAKPVAPAPVALAAPQTVAPAKPVPAPQAGVTTPFQTAATAKPTDPEVTSSLGATELPESGPLPAPPSAAQTTGVTRRQFGLDLGGSASEDAARANWATATRRYGTLLQGLRPVVVPREHARGGMEYRLVAGPINDASKAARFCAAITSMSGVCQPAMYDGQRVAGH